MHRVTGNLSVLQSLRFVQSVTGKTSLELRWVFSPHVRESKTVLDSGSQAVDFRFQVVDSSQSVEFGFWIPIVSRIPHSTSKNVPGSGIRISLHGATLGEYLLRLPSQSTCSFNFILFEWVITWFRVQFEMNNHEYIFQRPTKCRASRASSLLCGLRNLRIQVLIYSKLDEKNHVINWLIYSNLSFIECF